MRQQIQCISLSLLILGCISLKAGVLSDIHIQPFYDPNVNNSVYCTSYFNSTPFDIRPDVFSNVYAPLGRLYCDPPAALFENFLQKLVLVEPDIEVLFMTGDFVGHNLCIDLGDPDSPYLFDTLLEVHSNVSQYLAKHLPNTLIIPSFGNNDFKYHYQSADETGKIAFFTQIFDNWFTNLPVNSNLTNLALIKETFLQGGYYRVDISDTVSVLSLNTLMFAKKNIEINQGTQQNDQLNWIEQQLNSSEPERKFILTNHIYPSSKYENKTKALFHSNYSSTFVRLLETYTSKILIEISGHDHVPDLRYQKGKVISTEVLEAHNGEEEEEEEERNPEHHHNHHESDHKHSHHHFDSHTHENGRQEDSRDVFNYHNLLISPGVTSATGQNPGFTLFEIDTVSQQLEKVRMLFLPIEKTYNWTTIPDIIEFPFREVDFSVFGLEEITPTALDNLKERFEKNNEFLLQYLTLKVGYDPNDKDERQKAMNLHSIDLGLLTSDLQTYIYMCQMHSSLTKVEFDDCIAKNTPQKLRDLLFLKF